MNSQSPQRLQDTLRLSQAADSPVIWNGAQITVLTAMCASLCDVPTLQSSFMSVSLTLSVHVTCGPSRMDPGSGLEHWSLVSESVLRPWRRMQPGQSGALA